MAKMKGKIDDLRYLRNLAERILTSNTSYSRNRSIIDKFFKDDDSDVSLPKFSYADMIYVRLTLIDSFYSTNMTKHYEGLRNLAEMISKKTKSDADLRAKINIYKECLKQPELDTLFESSYGNPASQAPSLISKYFYFVTNHNFPIEDRLVRKNLKKFLKKYGREIDFLPYSKGEKSSNLIKHLLKLDIAKESFSAFDNLIWLYGKISSKSYSLILKGKGFEKAVESNGNVKKLRTYVAQNIGITNDLCDFIEKINTINNKET